jgi:hypothetical protein
MDDRLWKVITIVLGAIVFVCLILIIIFGVRLSNNTKIIEKQTLIRLAAQEKKLKDDFQKEKETEDFQYTADPEFGSFQFSYPKVWSTNITKELGAKEEFIFLADPSLINIDNKGLGMSVPVALRVTLYTEKYEDMVIKLEKDNKKKTMTETDVEVSGLPGKKFKGVPPKAKLEITYTVVKFRDKTLYIGTDDSAKYEDQYNKILSSFYLNR